MLKRIGLTITLLFGAYLLLLANDKPNAQKELKQRTSDVIELLTTDPEMAFTEIEKIVKKAEEINDKNLELKALNLKCEYFMMNHDFEQMISSAKTLYQKAESYKLPVYQVISQIILFQAYTFSGLPEKGFKELEHGKELALRLSDDEQINLITKAHIFISYSNYYSVQEDYENHLKYIKLSGKEIEKLDSSIVKERSLYTHYSNMASAHNLLNNLDSAKYYVKLSSAKEQEFFLGNVQLINWITQGKIAVKEGDYIQALSYYKKAEKAEGYKYHLNMDELYDDIILSYQSLQQEDSVKLYKTRKDSLKLTITENQNKTLHKLLDEKNSKHIISYIYPLVFLLTIMAIPLVYSLYKNRALSKKEKDKQHYLEQLSESQKSENYSMLIDMVSKKDPAFMPYFDGLYPTFTQKILEINPNISPSEIEFCALLKLKIPTKDIIRYRNIAHRTVQNKKYLIRKKLNIPQNVDIYHWFGEI